MLYLDSSALVKRMDAIHLASALWWESQPSQASQQRDPLTMVVWDLRLRQASIARGLRVIGDEAEPRDNPR